MPVWARELFSSLECPGRLWGPRNLLFSGYRGSSPEAETAG